MRVPARRVVADVGLAVTLLYLSFWTYETANFLVLSLSGMQASISTNGIFPTGTAALSNAPTWSPLAKVLQTAISGLAALSVVYVARKRNLLVTEISAICLLSVFLSSFYWEALALIPYISYAIHVSVFVGVTATVEFVLFTLINRRHV